MIVKVEVLAEAADVSGPPALRDVNEHNVEVVTPSLEALKRAH
jgi:hypothetical protein